MLTQVLQVNKHRKYNIMNTPARHVPANPCNPNEYDTVVIYHGGKCLDGAASAAAFTPAAAEFAKRNNIQIEDFGRVRFHGTSIRDFRADKNRPSLANKNVFIVDYSYPRDTIIAIKNVARRLRVFDHHESAKRELEGIEGCIFDSKRCGAEITWMEVVGIVPWWITHVRDHDLWEWKDPRSKAFACAVRDSCSYGEFARLLHATPEERAVLLQRGTVIHEHEEYATEMICRQASMATMTVNSITGAMTYNVICVNTPVLINEVGNRLAETNPGVTCAVLYYYDGRLQLWKVSLRGSRKSSIDLSVIAEAFGGGGHKPAAAFSIADIKTLLQW